MKLINHKILIQQNGLLLLFILNVPTWAMDHHATMDMSGMSEMSVSMHPHDVQNSSSSNKPKATSHHAVEEKSFVHHSRSSPVASDMTKIDHTSMQTKQDINHSHISHGTTEMNDSAPMHKMDHRRTSDMSMTSHTSTMQGGTAPRNARGSDYSQGRDFGPIHPPMMMGNDRLMSLSVKRLEVFHGSDRDQGAYEVEGWWGDDWNRAVLKAEGEVDHQTLSKTKIELLWRKPLGTFWNTELGVRQDSGYPKNRTWLSLGIEGISPYWAKLDATIYVRDQGQIELTLTSEYDWRITQRLILQPRVEISFYGKSDRINDISKGLSEIQSGLRLRYEISRQLALYTGLEKNQYYGQTADLIKVSNPTSNQSQAVAGMMFWF